LQAGSCAGAASFAPAASTLSGFTVTVTCSASVPAVGEPVVYTLQSTACSQPSAGACPNIAPPGQLYIERRLSVTF
jgi:MSHA biogenesis protein MshP